ncbi:conserved hypothetical protein [gamma proteobacterium HTCC5015]|nr:conserved hypothetical protein [gamma proteobacterium HTCC5015]
MAKFLNFVAFQLVWLACVMGASYHYFWAGLACAVIFACVTLLLSETVGADMVLLAVALAGGSLLDSSWALLGVLQYESAPWDWFAPPWILGLWLAFAMTINHSLAWLRFKPLWMAALAALACPFSYYAGERLGAVVWLNTELMLTLVPLTWGIFLALLCLINRKILQREGRHAVSLA